MERFEKQIPSDLPQEAREVLLEEEELAKNAREKLLSFKRPDPNEQKKEEANLLSRMRSLRDEATNAHTDDLSALLDQLHSLHALKERVHHTNIPDVNTPYFAHLRVSEPNRKRDYLLGRATFIASEANVRIVDWRHAPIARLFYLYREGDEFEEQLPGRVARGTIEARRVLVFQKSQLVRIITPAFTLERQEGIWKFFQSGERPTLAGGEGTAVRGAPDVTALLDQDQYEALEAHGGDPLLILGGAGSGKTTVALHRIASLVYREKQKFRPDKMRVIVPEEGLARLTTRLLRWLNVPGIRAETFARFARKEVVRISPKLSRRIADDTPPAISRLKQHPLLLAAIPGWLKKHPRPRFNPLTDWSDMFTDRAFLEDIVKRTGKEIPKSTALEVVRRTLRQLSHTTEKEYNDTDIGQITTLDGLPIDARTSDDLQQSFDEEDDAILLEIARIRRKQAKQHTESWDHLVLDEAQEFSALELSVLGGFCEKEKSITVAGDEAQRLDPFTTLHTWQDRLSRLSIPEAAVQKLQVSYRSSRAIALFAHEVLGSLAPKEMPNAKRPGAPVERFLFSAEGELTLFLLDTLQDLLYREGEASIAILTRFKEGARRIAAFLENHIPDARLVENGEFSFGPGVEIAEISTAKGLEFDYVIIPDADNAVYPDIPDARRALHVAATRAIHQLWILAVRKFSVILEGDTPGVSKPGK